jgi:site-specific DNA-methyltransferase (adenine-specific)
MKLYTETDQYKLYEGNMLDMLDVIPENSIDAIITDPPYELNFMNKGWDRSGIAFQKETWEKCLKVLKPGGYLLSFGGSRTFHRIACAIEDAGFEIRDTIMYLFGSGFPKSMNIGKAVEAKLTTGSANTQEFKNLDGEKSKSGGWGMNKRQFDQGCRNSNYDDEGNEYTTKVDYTTEEGKRWDGWGTALKPGFEPVIVARKPCEGSTTDNVLKYGVGGINIDECRVPTDDTLVHGGVFRTNSGDDRTGKSLGMFQDGTENTFVQNPNGRFPANVILTYDDSDFNEVCGGFPTTNSGTPGIRNSDGFNKSCYDKGWIGVKSGMPNGSYGDEGSAARYFYCAKASKLDRDEGLDEFIEHSTGDLQGGRKEGSAGSVMNPLRPDGHVRNNPLNPYAGAGGIKRNVHPTVKPTSLMTYLVRLVSPKGSTILDPFNGSGSTGKAVIFENRSRNADYKYIGIELSEEYLNISKARIDYAMNADMTVDDTGSVKLSNPSNRSKSQHRSFKLFDL